MIKRLAKEVGIAFMLITLIACSSAEEKKLKFFGKGKALYEQEEYTKALLNAALNLKTQKKAAN